MTNQFLVCDLSWRSSVKFALGETGEGPGPVTTYDCDSRDAFADRLRLFLGEHDNPALRGAALSARGWEENGIMQAVGEDVAISRHEIRDLLGIQRVNVVNNFVARALAVPTLRRNERVRISGEDAADETVIAVLGPHYGLGAAALVSDGAGGWTALPGEGGHSDLAARTERECEVLGALMAEHGYASRETALSLTGVTNLWNALHTIDGEMAPVLAPMDILALAKQGDARAAEVSRLISAWLGAFASDLALVLGARGGVYLTGALIDLMGDDFDTATFVERFHDKGPRTGYVQEIPVYRTQTNNLELKGLATLFD
ncbi:MAG TPA: glucokinase [Asticcacaulis sp.]|nr:glucokinase [Asticcacaulis sp.]